MREPSNPWPAPLRVGEGGSEGFLLMIDSNIAVYSNVVQDMEFCLGEVMSNYGWGLVVSLCLLAAGVALLKKSI